MPLTEANEVLRIQVRFTNFGEDRIMSNAFEPTLRQNWMLSTHRQRVDPKDAHTRYTSIAGDTGKCLESAGTWGISIGDINAQEFDGQYMQALDDEGTVTYDDGETLTNPRDHASADFRALAGGGQARKMRKDIAHDLRDRAMARRCLFFDTTTYSRPMWVHMGATATSS